MEALVGVVVVGSALVVMWLMTVRVAISVVVRNGHHS